jgi:hypothetical protein
MLWWTPPAPANKPAAEEFTIPLQTDAPRSSPRSADRVRKVKDELTGQPALQAKTAQAAINAAISQNTAGCQMIRFSAGFGWTATGNAAYSASNNPVALRRSRQEARFKAFTEARNQLAGCLRALPPEARRKVAENLEQDDAIRLALINLAANDAEKWEQALRILARGFVAYSVEDHTDQSLIQVNLVATPKTATRLTRPNVNAIETTSIQEGLRQALAEIQAGLIPPAGNRLIVVNTTGELTLVGYAFNLIGAHPDPEAQNKLRADAEKIATAHATEALIGLATGDDTGWKSGLDEVSQNEMRAAANGYDDNEPSVRRFAQIRDLVMTAAKEDSGLQTLRDGNLPAAAAMKRFSSEDTVAVAVVYTPTVRKPAPPPPPPATESPASNAPVPSIPATLTPSSALPSATPAAEPPTGSIPPVPPESPSAPATPPATDPPAPQETR